MKAVRFLRALPLALMLFAAPVRAEQGTIVGPITGPHAMADVMGTINASMLAIQSCNSGTSAPANGVGAAATHYQCWADTTTNPVVVKMYDGTSWALVGKLDTSAHTWTPIRQGTDLGTASIAATGTSGHTLGFLDIANTWSGQQTFVAPVLGAATATTLAVAGCSMPGGAVVCATGNFATNTGFVGPQVFGGTATNQSLTVASTTSGSNSGDALNLYGSTVTIGNQSNAASIINLTGPSGGGITVNIAAAGNGLNALNVFNGAGSKQTWVPGGGATTITFPTATDTLMGVTAAQTPTNKTFNCANNTCTVRIASDVSGLGTGITTALGVNVGTAGAPVVNGGALGTPSSGVGTNLTGTASGLIAGNVTTNANLTGDVTSVGNATTLTNAPVIAKVLTGFTSGAGTVSAADSILSALQKINGNDALKAPLARNVSTGCGLTGGGDLSADRTLKLSLLINPQVGTSYTVVDGDCSKLVTLSNASAVAVSLPQANGSTFVSGWSVDFQNRGAGLVTVTPVTSTINGGASIALAQNQGMHCQSDGTNYSCMTGVGAGGGSGTVTNVATTYPVSGGPITATGTLTSVAPTDSGQLTWTSITALAFKPYKGDTIKISGAVLQIPSGGISGLGAPTSVFLNGTAAQTLAINTTYFIYAFSNSGTVTADFSTTGHSASATAGNVGTEIKTGDDTRSLIGMVRTGGTVIYADDIRTASWFNRRRKSAIITNSLAAAGNTTAMNFVTWAEEAFTIMWSGYYSNTALTNIALQNRLDASVVGATHNATTGGANYTLPVTATRVMTSTEGNHSFDSTLSTAGSSCTGESSVEIRG